ncbi:DUF262 domain-containing protein [Oscillatoria sp. FACHB-1407]|uniref:GmrSD restriction endonuclease domain-containing protein n=1 Tax=Oscillatoria sp. FACHB-1407 TaxID=2692847 RepID=UPI001684EE4F|nr:DUF262 domain-containing protein [Oscillatoria sp. FACHB-1407]MBD2463397.1 DUF262 domain-containing protein [Oscillatoria sp. FACHB-1407]
MATTQKIHSLIDDIQKNRYFLPEFQRGFRWNSEQVKKYFQSLYRGYPTGAFLVWKAEIPSKIKGTNPSEENTFTRLILDGQQRLTTLYTLLKGFPPNWIEGKPPRTDLYFNLDTEEFQYFTQTLMSGKKEWIAVADLLQKGAGGYIANAATINPELSVYLVTQLERLNRLDNIKNYEYYIQEVEQQDPMQVVEIFNLVNSAGTPLSDSDLALALITGRWEDCKDKMRAAAEKYSKVNFHFNLDFFTRCISVIATSRGVFDNVSALSRDDLINAWNKTEKSLDYLVNVLPQHGYIDDTTFLSTPYVFFPLIYYISNNNFKFPDTQTRDKFLYWVYNALMWGRYSSSSESALDRDVRILKETNSVDELIKMVALVRGGNLDVTEADLELQGVRSRLYQIFYILVRRNGAADWADPSLPLYNNIIGRTYSIERHHIFPKSKLYKIFSSSSSYDKSLVNELANIALITSATNHSIFNNDPSAYLPNIDANQLRCQFVPVEPELWTMSRDGYLAFIKERRRLLALGINSFLNELYQGKSTIHVSRDVDQWRQRLEEVELAIRQLILDVAAEHEEDIEPKSYIPHHFVAKVDGRAQKYLRDNPSEDPEEFKSLEKQLQFFDISEYCELMISSSNWQYFEPYFGSKGAVQSRFTQLQNLRNTLAHNRDLTDVIIKDGEAAILWFSSILRKYSLAAA